MLETIAALCVVLGAIVLLRVLLVRLGLGLPGATGERRIHVLESRSIGAKQHLHLIDVDGQRLLLGASEAGVQRLARLPRKPDSRDGELEREAKAEAQTGVAARIDPEVLAIDHADPDMVAKPAARRGAPRLVNVLGAWFSAMPIFLAVLGLFLVGDASAQQAAVPGGATLSLSIDGATGPEQLSDTLKVVLILTAISVAPSILLMATCFTRILIVLALLRQAIGTATLPPNQVLVSLALLTTVYVMTPVGELVYEDALAPYMASEIGGEEAMALGIAPVRDYLLQHTRESDLLLFVEMKGVAIPEAAEDVSLSVLMPAFMISELRAAFEIGFMIYLPFLVVDLVIASMLISLGMIMLPPVMIALPFKLMLFVLVDGWNLTLTALVSGLQ